MKTPFQHCSGCGSAALMPRSEREFTCSLCHFRHFITPIPAAVALILDTAGRILVTRRAHEPGLGLLGLPGGVIEGGETGEEACSRETLEEVGLHIPAKDFRYFRSLPNQYPFQGFVWPTLDLFYLAEIQSFDGVMINQSEVAESLVLSLNEVPLADFAFASNAEAVSLLKDSRHQNSTTFI
jgi:ADP-ribose pyrophosphatase